MDKEFVLDFIVERKEVDDLYGSIKDNRYRDQKLRLLVLFHVAIIILCNLILIVFFFPLFGKPTRIGQFFLLVVIKF